MQPWLSQTAVPPGCRSSGTRTRLPTSSSLGLEGLTPPVPLSPCLPAEHSRFGAQNEPFQLGGQMHFYICLEKNGRGSAGSQERLLN